MMVRTWAGPSPRWEASTTMPAMSRTALKTSNDSKVTRTSSRKSIRCKRLNTNTPLVVEDDNKATVGSARFLGEREIATIGPAVNRNWGHWISDWVPLLD